MFTSKPRRAPVSRRRTLQELWSQLFLHIFRNSNDHENDWYATKNNDSNNNNNHEICGIIIIEMPIAL